MKLLSTILTARFTSLEETKSRRCILAYASLSLMIESKLRTTMLMPPFIELSLRNSV